MSVIQKKKKERKTKPNKILKTTSSASSPSQQQQQADVLNFPCEGQRKYFSRSDVVISGLRLRLGWPRANTRRRDGGGEESREERREERGEERREERREEKRGERIEERRWTIRAHLCVSLLGGGAAFGRQAALQNGRNAPRGGPSMVLTAGAITQGTHPRFYCLNARERVKGESISTKLTSVFVLFVSFFPLKSLFSPHMCVKCYLIYILFICVYSHKLGYFEENQV